MAVRLYRFQLGDDYYIRFSAPSELYETIKTELGLKSGTDETKGQALRGVAISDFAISVTLKLEAKGSEESGDGKDDAAKIVGNSVKIWVPPHLWTTSLSEALKKKTVYSRNVLDAYLSQRSRRSYR